MAGKKRLTRYVITGALVLLVFLVVAKKAGWIGEDRYQRELDPILYCLGPTKRSFEIRHLQFRRDLQRFRRG